ncbi:MAG TPA: NUDIX domain-containing protein [Candidatus Acidoferrales bacterium]
MTTVVAAIIARNSRLLICQRRRDRAFPLKWEFPGGKVEAGESLTEALGREILEELGVQIEAGREVYRTQYRYAELSAPIEIVFYTAKITDTVEAFNASGAFEKVVWVTPAELPEYEFLAANTELVARVASGSLSLE